MTRQQQSFERLKRIRIELDAARYALARAEAKWDIEAATAAANFRGEVTLNELRRAKGNLDRTFFLTLFAEFEGILLDYWQDGLGRRTKPKVSVLINRIADSCPNPVSDTHRDDVHLVRNYRNSLVHSHAEPAAALTVAECIGRFGKYLAYLPQRW
jgi:hypothetical protein